jgi:ParB family transcriptional regulator, chromosome partitioning protein
MSKNVLGRGLNTLLPSRSQPPQTPQSSPETPVPDPPVTDLAIDKIVPNPFQPRKAFDQASLNELAQSIRTDGVIQPLAVRKSGDRYQIIAGERRWRASQIAGLTTVPVRVTEMADDRMLEVALVENIQREDLNPIETAIAFHSLSEDLGLSHEEIGQRTGKDRATITNFIRLLQLPADVQQLVQDRTLSPGHARALLKLDGPDVIRDFTAKTIMNDWSVRTLEQVTTKYKNPSAKLPVEEKTQDPNVRAAIDDLERVLGTRVRIVEKGRGKGRVEIDYFSQDDLDRIYSVITSR